MRYHTLHQSLLTWYEENGRHALPWRATDDPYKIYISEVMLQQTQVKTVLERFYFPFLETFPTLADLAAADLDNVLKQWEGLGYYTRAKNLHKAARLSAPHLPNNIKGLMELPGIGKSTAHAIGAFAYDIPVPILDANVKRILYRFFRRRKVDGKGLWRLAERLFDRQHPFEYNQAMMDIGATVCLPNIAHCTHCPLQSECKGSKKDPLRYRAATVHKSLPVRQRHIIVYQQGEHYGLQQRTGRFLHGLWGFYMQETRPKEYDGILKKITQTYSHFKLEADVWLLQTHSDKVKYFTHDTIKSLALSSADHKVLSQLV